MPEPISVISSVGSVIGTSAKIIQLFHRISQQYAGSELYMAQATAECTTVRLALVQLQESLESRYTLGASSETRGEVLASVEAVTMVCALSLSKLEEYVTTSVEALPEAEDGESLKHLGKRQKLKIAWNHDEIGHHLQQLRGCQSSLTLLLGVLQCRSTAKMCSLLAETRATLERVHLAIRDAGFDGVSLSGMTLQIEEAFEIVQPGKMIINGSGSSRQDEQEARVHELVDSWEPQDGSQHLLRVQADDLVDTTPDTQLVAAAKKLRKMVSAPGTKEPQSGTRRPFVVNIFQNIRIMVSPKTQPKEPGHIEKFVEDGKSWRDLTRTLVVISNYTRGVIWALQDGPTGMHGCNATYRYNGRCVGVSVISETHDRVHLADLFMKYVGPETYSTDGSYFIDGVLNFGDCRDWKLMKVDEPLYERSDPMKVKEEVAMDMEANFGSPSGINLYHTAEKMGKLTPLKWMQPTTESTDGIRDMVMEEGTGYHEEFASWWRRKRLMEEGIRALVMQAVGLLLDSEDRKTRQAKFGNP